MATKKKVSCLPLVVLDELILVFKYVGQGAGAG
jgi:hypothetical protein